MKISGVARKRVTPHRDIYYRWSIEFLWHIRPLFPRTSEFICAVGSLRETLYTGRKFVARDNRFFFPKRGRALEGSCGGREPDVINPAGVLQIDSVRVYWMLYCVCYYVSTASKQYI